jgi:hypothetical protein
MIKLTNWTLCTNGDRFTAPECRDLCAGGEAKSHPRLGSVEGAKLVTSPIKYARGNIVRTQNSTYELVGPPCAFFVESVLDKHSLTFDGDLGPIVAHLQGR